MKLPLDFWESEVALLSTTDPSGHQVVELREEIITPIYMWCTDNITRSFNITKKEKPIEACNSTAYSTTYDSITNLRNTRKPQSQVFLFLVFNYSSVTRELLKHNGNATQIEWEKKDEEIRQSFTY